MSSRDLPQVLFVEQQRFTQVWLWLVVAAISALQWWGFIQQIILHRPFGDNPEPDWLLLPMAVVFGLGLPLFMYSCRLVSVVQSDALYVRFVPFHWRALRFDFGAIRGCQAVRYNPLLDYGGWGIKYGRHGQAYSVSGSQGVLLELANGRKLLIGSRRAEEFAAALNSATAAASSA